MESQDMEATQFKDPRDLQFQRDIYDVFCSQAKKIEDFQEPYRTRLKNAYRFSGQADEPPMCDKGRFSR